MCWIFVNLADNTLSLRYQKTRKLLLGLQTSQWQSANTSFPSLRDSFRAPQKIVQSFAVLLITI